MEITWLGHACFRLRSRDVAIVLDPYHKEFGNLGRPTADIVLISHDHPGHSGTDQVVGVRKVLTAPGEYEIKAVPIVGVQTAHDGEGGRRRGRNVAWVLELDDVSICHLGDIGDKLTSEQVDAVGNVDVLMVPVGGHNTVNAAQAMELVTQLEPKIVIPMHYATGGQRETPLDTVDAFLREQGTRDLAPQAKLTITKASLPEETQVVLLGFKR